MEVKMNWTRKILELVSMYNEIVYDWLFNFIFSYWSFFWPEKDKKWQLHIKTIHFEVNCRRKKRPTTMQYLLKNKTYN